MLIRGANKSDFKVYLLLRREEEKAYSEITGTEIRYPEDDILKVEFTKILKSDNNFVLVAEEDSIVIGYIYVTCFRNQYSSGGYIEDLFITEKFLRKGIATKLILAAKEKVNSQGFRKLQLSVNTKNKGALKLYEKLGFKIHHYELKTEW